ncbi:MAG: hypothetical protein AAFZ17_00570 [Cyanobacteria bacterium J06650_10]
MLWNQLEQLGHDLNIDALKYLGQRLVGIQQSNQSSSRLFKLLPNNEDSIEFSILREAGSDKFEMDGTLSAFQVDDAYIADFTLFSRSLISLRQLGQLNLNEILFSPRIQTALGKTLVLYAEVETLYKEDQQLSEALVVQACGSQTLPEYCSEGKLLGCSILEYSITMRDTARQGHVLVLINHAQFPAEMDVVIERLLYLFLSRHKILYTYQQANICNRRARSVYRNLEQTVVQPFNEIAQASDHLTKFQEVLRTQLPQDAFQYAQCLRNLSDYVTTLDTNLANYNQKLSLLDCCSETDLAFLQRFSDLAEIKYKTQVQIYLDYLRPGQALFQQLIDTIRGLVDVEQATNDRRLGTTVQVLGVSLATGAIVGAGYGYIDKPWRRPFSTSVVHPFIAYLLWSFGIGIISGSITYWLVKWKAKLSK